MGCGTSQGVPMVACDCAVCRSPDPRDSRTRCSLYMTTPDGTRILVDTSPELRQQALRERLTRVDAVLFTHEHADHIAGFDDLRQFCAVQKTALPIYACGQTLAALRRNFYWAFDAPEGTGYVRVTPHELTPGAPLELGGLTITPLEVPHADVQTVGYLFAQAGRPLLGYFCDAKEIPQAVRAQLAGIPILILDGLRDEVHPTHQSIPEAIEATRTIGAGRTFLTHLTHQKTHSQRSSELPAGIEVAYDGMQLIVPI